jgi:YfiH family protein
MKTEKLTQYANLTYSNHNETPYVSFPILEQFDFIRHGASTQLGGVSEGIYKSMNLGFNRGDLEERVFENYRLFCESLGTNEKDLVFTDQVHKDNVRVATSADKGMGILRKRAYSEIDGHITKEEGVPLVIFSADCVPIFYVDPVVKAIGATHSGWRGTVLKIGAKTVYQMELKFQSKPEDIVAVIGPCICKKCYEVSEDVAQEFMVNFKREQWEQFIEKNPRQQEQEQKYQLDLWEANRLILLEAGLKPENIVVSELCTMCRSNLFFSHRATKGQRGSMVGIIEIKTQK